MGKLNLLKGIFTGNVGTFEGQPWKNLHIIKTAKKKNTPQTALQTTSRLAFEPLNRLSIAIAKLYPQYLGMKSDSLPIHSNFTHFLKPLISNKEFSILKLAECVNSYINFGIKGYFVNSAATEFSYEFESAAPAQIPAGTKTISFLVRDDGNVIWTKLSEPDYIKHTETIPEGYNETCNFGFILSAPHKGDYKIIAAGGAEAGEVQYVLGENITGDIWINGKPIFLWIAEDTTVTNDTECNIEIPQLATVHILDAKMNAEYLVVDTPVWFFSPFTFMQAGANDNYGQFGFHIHQHTGALDCFIVTDDRAADRVTKIRNKRCFIWYTKDA